MRTLFDKIKKKHIITYFLKTIFFIKNYFNCFNNVGDFIL